MKKKWVVVLSVFMVLGFIGCSSLGDLFLTDQQKQWKAEGRNIKTGLFDEPYSGRSFQEKTELDAFKETAAYKAAVTNYTTWKSIYTREQSRVDEENRKIQSRNQAAWDDTQSRAHRWILAVKDDGIKRRIFNPGALFEEKYNPNGPFFTELVAILFVDNKEVARNTFVCKREALIINQVGDYDPRKKY